MEIRCLRIVISRDQIRAHPLSVTKVEKTRHHLSPVVTSFKTELFKSIAVEDDRLSGPQKGENLGGILDEGSRVPQVQVRHDHHRRFYQDFPARRDRRHQIHPVKGMFDMTSKSRGQRRTNISGPSRFYKQSSPT